MCARERMYPRAWVPVFLNLECQQSGKGLRGITVFTLSLPTQRPTRFYSRKLPKNREEEHGRDTRWHFLPLALDCGLFFAWGWGAAGFARGCVELRREDVGGWCWGKRQGPKIHPMDTSLGTPPIKDKSDLLKKRWCHPFSFPLHICQQFKLNSYCLASGILYVGPTHLRGGVTNVMSFKHFCKLKVPAKNDKQSLRWMKVWSLTASCKFPK